MGIQLGSHEPKGLTKLHVCSCNISTQLFICIKEEQKALLIGAHGLYELEGKLENLYHNINERTVIVHK